MAPPLRPRLGAGADEKRDILRGLAALGLRVDPRAFDRLMGTLVRAALPVGSCCDGFFWMTTRKDFDLARQYITTRFKPMRGRADAIAAQERRRFPPRLPLLDDASAARAVRVARGRGGKRRRRP